MLGFEVFVGQSLLGCDSLLGVFREHRHDQILNYSGLYHQVESLLVKFDVFDILKHRLFIFVLEGQRSTGQIVEEDAARPHVDLFVVALL